MQRLREAIDRVARHPTAVLLTGETGTGKGFVARRLHRQSPRRDAPFVHVDCAGLADGLLEAELYGVARGGYTGAQHSRAGRFEVAGRGTLFLDEVGELSISGQRKLLRVLEEGVFERVGETRPRRLGARVVAATHVDLALAVARGDFRADLFHRLRVLSLHVPPLRERCAELDGWIDRAAERAGRRLGTAPPRLEPDARASLCAHPWPGNLRELFHLVEAAAVLADGVPISASRVDGLLADSLRTLAAVGAAEAIVREPCERTRRELEAARGNLSLAARRLGIPRSTLRYRLGLDDALTRVRRARRLRSRPDAARLP